MNYANVRERLPALIKILENTSTEYRSDKKYLGEAQAYLSLLMDIIDSQQPYNPLVRNGKEWKHDNLC